MSSRDESQAAGSEQLEDRVQRVLETSGLRGARHERVARELRAHIEDALAAGISPSDIAASFGDPELCGSMLRRLPPPREPFTRSATMRLVRAASLAAGLALSVSYGTTAARFASFGGAPVSAEPWLDSLATFARNESFARAQLREVPMPNTSDQLERIRSAVDAARRAAASNDRFGRLVAVSIAGDVVGAASRLQSQHALTPPERQTLRHALRDLATVRAQRVERQDVLAWFDAVAARSFDARGRLMPLGLRAAQAMKGVRDPSIPARVLEPVFFARASDVGAARSIARTLLDSTRGGQRDLWTVTIVEHARRAMLAQREIDEHLPVLLAKMRVLAAR